jgi:hypothetical protein
MDFYTYAYLREDGTPYYVGKGRGTRVYYKRTLEVKPPRNKERIIFLKKNLTEDAAFKHEIYMISVLGRKDLGTGILRNKTNGGEGVSGAIISDSTRQKRSERFKGNKNPMYGKKHSEESRLKMKESRKGMTYSEEHNRKLAEARKKPHSEETKKKLSELAKGRKHTEKTKQKIAEATRLRHQMKRNQIP